MVLHIGMHQSVADLCLCNFIISEICSCSDIFVKNGLMHFTCFHQVRRGRCSIRSTTALRRTLQEFQSFTAPVMSLQGTSFCLRGSSYLLTKYLKMHTQEENAFSGWLYLQESSLAESTHIPTTCYLYLPGNTQTEQAGNKHSNRTLLYPFHQLIPSKKSL